MLDRLRAGCDGVHLGQSTCPGLAHALLALLAAERFEPVGKAAMLPLFQQGVCRLIDVRAVLRATPGLCDAGNDPGALPAPAAFAQRPGALQLVELLVQPDKLLRLLLLLLFQPDQAPQLRRSSERSGCLWFSCCSITLNAAMYLIFHSSAALPVKPIASSVKPSRFIR